jgi:hypothetical protein
MMDETAIVKMEEPAASTPMGLIERALAIDASPEKLKLLMDLQERWEASHALKSFNKAFAAAKAEFEPIIKNKRVSFESKNGGKSTEYDHEDFAQISRTVDPILSKHGLFYRFETKHESPKIWVTCILTHVDGHSVQNTAAQVEDHTGNKNANQAGGSGSTYGQRYSLKGVLGLAVASDDDGRAKLIEGSNTITADEFVFIKELIEKCKADEAKVLGAVKAESFETMTQKQYREAVARLTAWQKKTNQTKAA